MVQPTWRGASQTEGLFLLQGIHRFWVRKTIVEEMFALPACKIGREESQKTIPVSSTAIPLFPGHWGAGDSPLQWWQLEGDSKPW